ncbi:MAG: M42 family peptidase [Anaerolineae bacterium]|nr:M42 family peptidase [Anaerolineae bacterium]
MTLDLKAHLKTLCNAHGPTGHERPIHDLIREAWTPYVSRFDTSPLGSLVGYRDGSGPGPRPKIMLCAHMDEIGMVVNKIERGFLHVSDISGTDNRNVAGKPVIVHGREPVRGVVAVHPRHTLPGSKQSQYPDWEDLFVDVGLLPEEVEARIRVGDVVTLDTPALDLAGSRVAGKAFDNRSSVAAVTVCLDALASRVHAWDVLAVASVQEEGGAWGAGADAHRIAPDLAIALDVTFAPQPGTPSPSFRLGGGPTLGLGPNFHPALMTAIRETADRLEIPLTYEPTPAGSGTDAWPIQIAREGIPAALLGAPVRNMHSSVETLDTKDVERLGRLLAEFIAELTPDFVKRVVWDADEQPESESAS